MPAKKKAAARKASAKPAAKKAAPKPAARKAVSKAEPKAAPQKPAAKTAPQKRRGVGPQPGDALEGVLVNDAPAVVASVVNRVGPRAWRVTLVGGAHEAVITAVKSGVWTTRDGA